MQSQPNERLQLRRTTTQTRAVFTRKREVLKVGSTPVRAAIALIRWSELSESRLLDFGNLALCDHRPRPTVFRCLGLIRVELRRHLHFGIPEFNGLSFYRSEEYTSELR